MNKIKNLFSVDLEDWYHAYGNIDQILNTSKNFHKYNHQSILSKGCEKILEIIERKKIKSTFFILGQVAKNNKSLIRQISNLGHEIASHGYNHLPIYLMNKSELKEDLHKSKILLEDIVGKEIISYRAPSFSLKFENIKDFYDTLSELGYQYSSSSSDGVSDFGGDPKLPNQIKKYLTKNEKYILEFPSSNYSFFFNKFNPVGGGYIRLLNKNLIRFFANRLINNNIPLNLYVHPRELVTDHPKISSYSIKRYFKSYYNIGSTNNKIKFIVENFEFDSLKNILKDY